MENNNITNKTTFWELLNNYEIVVPIIQRDYAQGRAGKEDLRINFLGQIRNALIEKNSDLLLDFVYGTINNNKIYPLDGQQRLTTLWLLHWYYFYKNGLLEKNKEKNKEILKRFSYETRDSSKEFIKFLCEKEIKKNKDKRIDELIQEQTWFLTKWKHDPTIQAMLRMLSGTYKYKKVNNKLEPQGQGDGIEQLFNNDESLNNLVGEDCPIKFLFLDLEGIKQSDNLYIKMNARGKQLTSFENFKADLIDFIQKDNKKEINNPERSEYNDWANKWDTEWTDIFWKEKNDRDEIDEIDNLYFAFIKRYLYNEIALNDSEENKGILKNLSSENQEYTSFKDYEFSIKNTFGGLCRIFNNLLEFKDIIKRNCEYIKLLTEYKFIPQYEKNKDKEDKKVCGITFQERILFYGICEYLKQKNIDANNEENLRQWLRILANLTYYDEITNEKEFALRLKSVRMVCDKILGKSSNIYVSLCKINIEADDTINNDPIKNQLKEEQRKIMLISQDEELEDDIIKFEGFKIFQSHIDCLLNLIVCDSSKKEKICQRKLSKLLTIIEFEEFNNVKFKPHGLLRLLFRAILTKYEKEEPNKLLINNEHVRFRKLLNKSGEFYEPFQSIMREFLNLKDSNIEFKAYLENIISNYKNKDWKVCLVKSDYLWTSNFSETMKIHTRNNTVYLYKGTNANKKDIKLSGNQCGVSCPLRKSNKND